MLLPELQFYGSSDFCNDGNLLSSQIQARGPQSSMNKIGRAVLLGIFVAGSTLAQDTLSGRAPNQNSSASFEQVKYELILHQLEADHAPATVEVAKRRAFRFQ